MATSRDRLDELFQHCADLGIDVRWQDLGETRRGEYHRLDNTIVLSPRLTGRQVVACLAHELGHQRFGHSCSSPANERRAWEYAAALVITPTEYAVAEARVGPDAAGLAIELAVTPRLVEAWRRWWHKRGHRGDRGVTVTPRTAVPTDSSRPTPATARLARAGGTRVPGARAARQHHPGLPGCRDRGLRPGDRRTASVGPCGGRCGWQR